MTTYAPIFFPPQTDPSWLRAEKIVRQFRSKGKANPFCVAAVANGLAESGWKPHVIGDNGQSFGPWQLKKQFYASPILNSIEIDITSPNTTLEQRCDALLCALSLPANKATLEALDAAVTGAEATRIWAAQFERASAGGAVERRVALAGRVEVWLSKVS